MFVLILIVLTQNGDILAKNVGEFPLMNQCFDERELLVERIGRPIVNYQAICIHRAKV